MPLPPLCHRVEYIGFDDYSIEITSSEYSLLKKKVYFNKEDVMETSDRFYPTDSLSPASPTNNIWASVPHDRDHHMATPSTPQSTHRLNKASPSQKPGTPLRLALCIRHPKSLQTLSLLEHIPGVEIVGIADQPASDQEPNQMPESQDPLGTPSTLLFNQTSPHILLDFTDAPLSRQTASPW